MFVRMAWFVEFIVKILGSSELGTEFNLSQTRELPEGLFERAKLRSVEITAPFFTSNW